MSLLLHVTLARVRKNIKKSLLPSLAVFFSCFMISFFCCFILSLGTFKAVDPAFGLEAVDGEHALTIASLRSFVSKMTAGIRFIAVSLVILSFLSFMIYTRLRAEDSKRFLATLTSIGATNHQRNFISLAEALILYGIPITLGSFLGLLPSKIFTDMVARIFTINHAFPLVHIAIPALLAVIGIVLALIFTHVPPVGRKRSVTEAVRAHNKGEADKTHSYRNSHTFRRMPIEQRIAKKGVAYYSDTYRRIALMFICCVLYPVLAVIFFMLVSEADVTDHTPHYGVDATDLAGIFAKNIAIFGALAFLALTVLGVLQAMHIVQAHNRVRREALATYKGIGMPDESIKKVLKYEYRTAFFHALAYLVFILVLVFVGIARF